MSFQNRHVGGVIIEPDRIPAVRESACLHLIALQRTWPRAGHPNCYQTCLIIVFGGLRVWAVKWAELSVRSASGQQLHHVRPAERWTNKGQTHLVQPSRHPFCYITDVLFFGCFGCCHLPDLEHLRGERVIHYFQVLEAASVRQKGAVALIKSRATGFSPNPPSYTKPHKHCHAPVPPSVSTKLDLIELCARHACTCREEHAHMWSWNS